MNFGKYRVIKKQENLFYHFSSCDIYVIMKAPPNCIMPNTKSINLHKLL